MGRMMKTPGQYGPNEKSTNQSVHNSRYWILPKKKLI